MTKWPLDLVEIRGRSRLEGKKNNFQPTLKWLYNGLTHCPNVTHIQLENEIKSGRVEPHDRIRLNQIKSSQMSTRLSKKNQIESKLIESRRTRSSQVEPNQVESNQNGF